MLHNRSVELEISMRTRVFLFLLLTIPALVCSAQPRTDYPTKFVRFIVPYAPGGSSDVLARALGQKLGEALGQSFVVDNRPGAGSMIGTDVAAKATPDGYTLILSDMPHTINPSIHAKVPYDPVRDFSPVTIIGVSPMFLFANPSLGVQNVKDFHRAREIPAGQDFDRIRRHGRDDPSRC
jgi:tripartite-type tricarboxylate transporter receptor subunit TctC